MSDPPVRLDLLAHDYVNLQAHGVHEVCVSMRHHAALSGARSARAPITIGLRSSQEVDQAEYDFTSYVHSIYRDQACKLTGMCRVTLSLVVPKEPNS